MNSVGNHQDEKNKALEAEIKHLKLLLGSSPAVIYTSKPFGDYAATYISEHVIDLLGYQPAEFVHNPNFWVDGVHAEDKERILKELHHLFENDFHIHEYRFRHKNGSYLWMLDEMKLIRDADGNPQEIIGSWIDITDRKSTETELAAQKEHLAVTLESIGDGVITTNIEGEILLVNKVAEKLTGWSQEKAAGQQLVKVFNIINATTRKPCENPVGKVLASDQTEGFANNRALLVARDGSERTIANNGKPIRTHDNKTVGFVWVFRDRTAQLRNEQELIKMKKLEAIGVLAGGIAHDFNNILAAILGNINLALFDEGLTDGTRNLLTNAEKASVRARDLTQQLLTFAKGGDPVKEASSLDDVIKDSANFILHGDKVGCHFNIPADLWIAEIDKGQIGQVIQNIILNACHAMPEGGTIRVTCENLCEPLPFLPDRSFVKIGIQDSGVGMPANMLEKIFDPYFSTKKEGSGLGLAISQSIIKKHNGHIAVESTPDVGSTFDIYLPRAEKIAIQKNESLGNIKTSFQAKVLIMDDEEIVRTVVKKMLVKLGHKVVLSVDGVEALKLYQDSIDTGKPFDLVIMDLTIPGGMGGAEAAQQVLKIDPDAKVIVSSGYSNSPIMADCKDAGFCSAIVKPYKLQELSQVITHLLD